MPRFNHEVGVRILKEAVNAYARAGVTAWIQDGTLLGAVREGRPIEWDNDMDLGLMSADYTPEADQLLLEAGFQNRGNYNTPDSDYHQKWYKRSVHFCVFHYYTDPDGRVWHGIRRKSHRFYYPEAFELAPIMLMGESFLAPYPPEAFLSTKYGDWRTPRQRWNSRKMPANGVSMKR